MGFLIAHNNKIVVAPNGKALLAPQNVLPSIYQEVEWIENTSGAYIHSNYQAKLNDIFALSISPRDSSTQPPFGARKTGAHATSRDQYYLLNLGGLGKWVWRIGTTSIDKGSWVQNATQNMICGMNEGNYDGTNDLDMIFFGMNSPDGAGSAGIFRFSHFVIFSGGQNIQFIPCYRKSDTEIGLYRTDTRVLLTKSGTGSLVKGPDVTYS